MDTEAALAALADYIDVLSNSAQHTHRAEDRSRYRDHLAATAALFVLLRNHGLQAVEEWVRCEQRSFGWDHLAGPEGVAAESAFSHFVGMMRHLGTIRKERCRKV